MLVRYCVIIARKMRLSKCPNKTLFFIRLEWLDERGKGGSREAGEDKRVGDERSKVKGKN